jgi:hypothetical protein
MKPIGKRRWAIAEGFIPTWSHGPEPEMKSHESVCILNASDQDAHVRITAFFSDQDAVDLMKSRCRRDERDIFDLMTWWSRSRFP